ncbi:MAG: 2-oxoisovalerate dehydrogenase [Dehalococcoidia bacterium]
MAEEIVFRVVRNDRGYLATALGYEIEAQSLDLEGLKAAVQAAVAEALPLDDRPTRIRLHLARDPSAQGGDPSDRP